MRQVVVTPETKFREVTDQLRASVSGMKAIVLIGPDGEILDHLALDPSFDVESFTSEYAMLLRIAQRSFEDTGAGDLTEHIAVSARSMTIARSYASESYIVVIADSESQIGRARYELKRAAEHLSKR